MIEKHTLVFIHGMGETRPLNGFKALWGKIRDSYDAMGTHRAGDFEARFEPCFVDWHAVTEDAKRTVFSDAFGPMEPESTFPGAALHPLAFGRTFLTYFLGDVVAYVDEDPNNIRTTIWNTMKEGLARGGSYSIIAHSLGSVVAFDFLFHLFVEKVLFDPVRDNEVNIADLERRFAGFYSMGSPVGLFMMRKGSLWKRTANAGRPFSEIKNPIPAGRVWQNFWDKQDLIAYPLQRLFATNPDNATRPLADAEVGTGPEPISAHLRYWKSVEVASGIAKGLAGAAPGTGRAPASSPIA